MIKRKKKSIDLRHAPYETDYKFPKSKFELGPEFKETSLGYSEGAIRQYRGPNNEHILEYETYYEGHRDRADPIKDPFGHLVKDAPESIISVLAAGIIGFIAAILLHRWKKKEERKRKNREKTERDYLISAILIIILLVLFTLGIWRLLKFLRESKRNRIIFR